MSSGDMHGSDAALDSKTNALQQRTNGLIAAINGGKNVRRMVFLLLLVGVGSYSYWLYTQYQKFLSEDRKKVYYAEFDKKKDILTKEAVAKVTELAHKKGDVVKNAFLDRLKADTP